MKEEALQLASRLAFHQGHLSMWTRNEASAMIRRLVEELDEKNYRILELTKRYKALTWNDKQSEPVAWANVEEGVISPTFSWKISLTKKEGMIPLYTTPQTKPLSDEEILEYSDVFSLDKSPLYEFTDKGLVLFARAIEAKVRGQ